jgi:cytoskeletal protein RodZ
MALWREGQWRMFMWLILLEALAALLLLVGIVWWTMFSGRKKGEPPAQEAAPNASEDIAQK